MKIDNKIKICGIIYDVKLISGKADNDLQEKSYIGRIDYERCTITLEREVNEQVLIQTLFHEITHGIAHNYKIEIPENDVDRIAAGFYQVLKDNKFLKELIWASN